MLCRPWSGILKNVKKPAEAPVAHALADTIAELCPRGGSHPTAIPGLYLTRFSTPTVPRSSLERAVFCVVAQGAKSLLANGRRYRYDRDKYILVSRDLPLAGQVEEASRARPFLGCSLVLDFDEIRSLMQEAKLP